MGDSKWGSAPHEPGAAPPEPAGQAPPARPGSERQHRLKGAQGRRQPPFPAAWVGGSESTVCSPNTRRGGGEPSCGASLGAGPTSARGCRRPTPLRGPRRAPSGPAAPRGPRRRRRGFREGGDQALSGGLPDSLGDPGEGAPPWGPQEARRSRTTHRAGTVGEFTAPERKKKKMPVRV